MGSVLNFFRRPSTPVRFTGFILARIGVILGDEPDDENKIVLDERQQGGTYGVHQARLRLAGDRETTYRLILAPADAPVQINGIPADEYFAEPLEVER